MDPTTIIYSEIKMFAAVRNDILLFEDHTNDISLYSEL